ncbi:MAG: urea ABC transporter permease subunit UrtB [Steroidobacteraceae bacterium]
MPFQNCIMRHWLWMLCLLTLTFGALSVQAAGLAVEQASSEPVSYDALVARLPTADYADKNEIIRSLLQLRAPGTYELLSAFLQGNLYARSSDGKVFIATATADASANELQLTDAISGQPAGTASAADFETIGSNNQLRKALRAAVAQFELSSDSAAARLEAVAEMLRSLDDDSVVVLREHLKDETNVKVQSEIQIGLALVDLDNSNAAVRLAAIDTLQGSLNPDVFNRLTQLVVTNEDGSYAEPDAQVRDAARKLLANMTTWRGIYSASETVFFGLSLGSVLVLSAIGLAITFGVMGVINMAHGELMMLGAYTTYVIQLLMPNHIGASVLVAIPLAFVVSGLVGVLIERGLVRFLYGRPLETLLATFGVSLLLQQIVRDIFSANNRPVEAPSWMAGSWQINEAFSLTYNRLYVVLFTAMVFIALLLILKRTTLGLNVRAVAQNRAMAKSMGIRTAWVDAMTFGLGSGIAGIAGVALSQLTNVGPNLGQQYIVDSFMVVVFGGVGNLWGTLISGMSLGVINKILEPYAGAVLAKILVLIFLILFIQRKPRGLFPQKGRSAEG